MSVHITAFPQAENEIAGFEPWHVAAILKTRNAVPKPHLQAILDAAEVMRTKGAAALSGKERAFWYAYESEVSPALVGDPRDATEKELALVFDTIDAIEEPNEEALVDAMTKAEAALVSRNWDIGLFAPRGAIKTTALPNWCRAAVIVNTKTKCWDLVVVGHHPATHLRLWASAALGGTWAGHADRVRQQGLPDIKALNMAVAGLRHILEDVSRRAA